MSQSRIGIIDGSGLYHIEGFIGQKWVKVIANLMKNADLAQAIFARTLPQLPTEPAWPCHAALKNAIMTERECWPAKTIRELEPILRKYLWAATKSETPTSRPQPARYLSIDFGL